MKKLTVGLLAFALLAAVIYFFWHAVRNDNEAQLTADMFVPASQARFDIGPKLGTHFPGVRATLAGREITLLNEFAGPNGVILVALRSVDWCPFCKRQLVELQENKALFDANGIGMVAITYDDPRHHADFSARHAIEIPLLADIDALTFKTLGILNPDYEPGHDSYGIPHPGMIIVSREGVVAGKLFVELYSQRVGARESLGFAKEALELESPFAR